MFPRDEVHLSVLYFLVAFADLLGPDCGYADQTNTVPASATVCWYRIICAVKGYRSVNAPSGVNSPGPRGVRNPVYSELKVCH